MYSDRPNWLHLDLKGANPGLDRLLDWIDFLASAGFNGIVWEYEDRLPWRTWPGTFRPGYTLDQWRQIWQRCLDRRLEVVPLVQVQGHLEWLLKHPAWASWRENGCYNELCPQMPEVLPAIERWLDELVEIHPRLRFIHIGADETWNLASCPRCQALAAGQPEGKMGIYIEHVGRICDMVIGRGMRPLIWADMFWRENRMDLASRLPEQTILVDWQYDGAGPWTTAEQLAASGREVFGASAVRRSYGLREAVAPLGRQVDNVRGWHSQAGLGGLIHTTWGRSRALMPLYGPWEGWLPVFLAAANPANWKDEQLRTHVPDMDAAMATPGVQPAVRLQEQLRNLLLDGRHDACRQWWILSLRLHELLMSVEGSAAMLLQPESVHRHIGVDPDTVQHRRAGARRLAASLDEWAGQVRAFFAAHGYADDDAREYVDSRLAYPRHLLASDWAQQEISWREPRSVR